MITCLPEYNKCLAVYTDLQPFIIHITILLVLLIGAVISQTMIHQTAQIVIEFIHIFPSCSHAANGQWHTNCATKCVEL